MELFVLDLKQLLEVKLLRLNKPKFNSLTNSITGNYNSLDDLSTINTLPREFQLSQRKST